MQDKHITCIIVNFPFPIRSHGTTAQLKKTLKEIMILRNFIMEDR